MRGWRRAWISAAVLLLVISGARAEELKFATWNLEWLTMRPAGDPSLPSDAAPKRPEDIATLARYAAELNADVIAIEEVDGPKVAHQVFPPASYAIHMTHDHVVQRVGLVVRRGIPFSVNPDVTSLDLPESGLRSGADITLHLPNGSLRILAVHLKTGCKESPLLHTRRAQCAELEEQVGPLADWISARHSEGVPFVVMGDFNRWLEGHDELLSAMQQAAPLAQATAGLASPCWGGENFIDHIFAGGPARDWMEPDTLRVLVYKETGKEWQERLSDHCLVSVRFNIPE